MWSWSAGTISLPGYIMIIVIVPLCILFFVYGILIDIIHYNSSDTLGQTSGACRIPVWECESVRVWEWMRVVDGTEVPTQRLLFPRLATMPRHSAPHSTTHTSTICAHTSNCQLAQSMHNVESTCDNDITSSIEHTTPALGDGTFCCSPHVTVLRLLIEA